MTYITRQIDETSGIITCEGHWVDSYLSRHEALGPARVIRDGSTGITVYEAFFLHGLLHRSLKAGPAVTMRDALSGNIIGEFYFVHGRPMKGEKGNLLPDTTDLDQDARKGIDSKLVVSSRSVLSIVKKSRLSSKKSPTLD